MKKVQATLSALLLLAMMPLQASQPPATLPKEFLAQLPLLMDLSGQAFEGLLASARQQSDETESAEGEGTEEKEHED